MKKLSEKEYWTVHVHLQLLENIGLRSLLRAYLKRTRRTLLKRNLPKHLSLEVVKSDHQLNVEVAGVKGTTTTDVVKADLPLLSGTPVLERAKIVINFDTDEAMIFGKKLTLEKLSIGHYVLPLQPNYQKIEPDVQLRTYEVNSKVGKERLCAEKKRHVQMAHPAQVKLQPLIKMQESGWLP